MGFPGTVNELKKILEDETLISEELFLQIATDKRKTVQKIYQQYLSTKEKEISEYNRYQSMFEWEEKLGSVQVLVAGVDEAGRGPLAGPVAAGAVILDSNIFIPGIKDSKKLSAKKRKELADVIKDKAVAWSLGWSTVEEIDLNNIHQASFLAMKRAINGLVVKPGYILVDGFSIPNLNLPQKALLQGDNISASIAAASILAKVARDKLMEELDLKYPGYGFSKNKGYPTQEHYQGIKLNGPSPIHRKTFKGV